MKILFLGDLVGKCGREAVCRELPRMIEKFAVDLTIVNGENSAGGFGITEAICEDLFDAGTDVITTGNHVWAQRETVSHIEREPRLLRPANFPSGTPGLGANIYQSRNGAQVMVMNIMGRAFIQPDLDDPFACAERLMDGMELGQSVDAIFVDFHAEATAEKQCFAHFLDGRVSAVIGTHTHVPTADWQILKNGTAYMSDAGMCGDYDSSLGMDVDEPLRRFTTKMSLGRFEPAPGPATICGVGIETDDRTGLAMSIAPLRLGPRLDNTFPW